MSNTRVRHDGRFKQFDYRFYTAHMRGRDSREKTPSLVLGVS